MERQKKWQKIISWYTQAPVLKNTDPILIIPLIAGSLLAIFFRPVGCPCVDQIYDKQLTAMAKQGNKAVIEYQQSTEDIVICAARRKALLEKLEKEGAFHLSR